MGRYGDMSLRLHNHKTVCEVTIGMSTVLLPEHCYTETHAEYAADAAAPILPGPGIALSGKLARKRATNSAGARSPSER